MKLAAVLANVANCLKMWFLVCLGGEWLTPRGRWLGENAPLQAEASLDSKTETSKDRETGTNSSV